VGGAGTYAISGRVVDGSGNPIAGVTVSATGGYSATSGADGRYAVSGLPAGEYAITAYKRDYAISPYAHSVNLAPDATGQDFTALPCIAPSGLDVCKLRPGDILVKRGSMDSPCAGAKDRQWIEAVSGTYFTHSALYVGDLKITEAAGPVGCESLNSCDRSEEVRETELSATQFWSGYCVTDWAVLRPEASEGQKATALSYALAKAQEEGVVFDIRAARHDDMRFYC